mmetsp:Transcript_104916/g.301654  ORF Transcript_104916/g.301654 Transcript_104916/m.301654 type:complete len:255 (-) Transcript_104916:232-996(-)
MRADPAFSAGIRIAAGGACLDSVACPGVRGPRHISNGAPRRLAHRGQARRTGASAVAGASGGQPGAANGHRPNSLRGEGSMDGRRGRHPAARVARTPARQDLPRPLEQHSQGDGVPHDGTWVGSWSGDRKGDACAGPLLCDRGQRDEVGRGHPTGPSAAEPRIDRASGAGHLPNSRRGGLPEWRRRLGEGACCRCGREWGAVRPPLRPFHGGNEWWRLACGSVDLTLPSALDSRMLSWPAPARSVCAFTMPEAR